MEELSKYEHARVIGARALQLSSGAPPLIKVETPMTFIELAQTELDKKVLPLTVFKEN
jgi:DNA-directed RNA polymerase subunit K